MDDRLTVALSMVSLVPGGMGGSETYARELVQGLAASTRVKAEAWVSRTGAGFATAIPEHVVEGVAGGPTTRQRVGTIVQARRMRGEIRRQQGRVDVVHYPFTAPVPWPSGSQRTVVSLHDLQHLDLPQLFSRAERLYRRRYYEAATRAAHGVVTISAFAKSRIIEHLGVDADRITVAHLGVDPTAFTPNLGPRRPFLLYPARGWAHKNHARLIEAVRLLRADQSDLRLVLTGGGLDALGPLPDWVDVRGHVPLPALHELYRQATCLVFPSLYEGFGLPPLEAMASGCPVAASTAGALPEVCGDAAVLFDAEDPTAIADGIREALGRRSELVERGLAQARRFPWSSCVTAHEDAYLAAAR